MHVLLAKDNEPSPAVLIVSSARGKTSRWLDQMPGNMEGNNPAKQADDQLEISVQNTSPPAMSHAATS